MFFNLYLISGNFDESKTCANCLTFDKSGNMLVVGYDDSNIRVFNAQNVRMETIFKGHEDGVLDLIFDPNNKSLITASSDKTFRIWQ